MSHPCFGSTLGQVRQTNMGSDYPTRFVPWDIHPCQVVCKSVSKLSRSASRSLTGRKTQRWWIVLVRVPDHAVENITDEVLMSHPFRSFMNRKTVGEEKCTLDRQRYRVVVRSMILRISEECNILSEDISLQIFILLFLLALCRWKTKIVIPDKFYVTGFLTPPLSLSLIKSRTVRAHQGNDHKKSLHY